MPKVIGNPDEAYDRYAIEQERRIGNLERTRGPGTELAYKTVAVTETFTVEETLVTFDEATYEDAKHYLEIAIPNLRCSTTEEQALFRLEDNVTGGLVGTEMLVDYSQNTAGYGIAVFVRMPFTPITGLRTYRVTAQRQAGGTFTVFATSFTPATFRIVKA